MTYSLGLSLAKAGNNGTKAVPNLWRPDFDRVDEHAMKWETHRGRRRLCRVVFKSEISSRRGLGRAFPHVRQRQGTIIDPPESDLV